MRAAIHPYSQGTSRNLAAQEAAVAALLVDSLQGCKSLQELSLAGVDVGEGLIARAAGHLPRLSAIVLSRRTPPPSAEMRMLPQLIGGNAGDGVREPFLVRPQCSRSFPRLSAHKTLQLLTSV